MGRTAADTVARPMTDLPAGATASARPPLGSSASSPGRIVGGRRGDDALVESRERAVDRQITELLRVLNHTITSLEELGDTVVDAILPERRTGRRRSATRSLLTRCRSVRDGSADPPRVPRNVRGAVPDGC